MSNFNWASISSFSPFVFDISHHCARSNERKLSGWCAKQHTRWFRVSCESGQRLKMSQTLCRQQLNSVFRFLLTLSHFHEIIKTIFVSFRFRKFKRKGRRKVMKIWGKSISFVPSLLTSLSFMFRPLFGFGSNLTQNTKEWLLPLIKRLLRCLADGCGRTPGEAIPNRTSSFEWIFSPETELIFSSSRWLMPCTKAEMLRSENLVSNSTTARM